MSSGGDDVLRAVHDLRRVCERFPGLRVAFLEANCSWAPYWLWRIDEHYQQRERALKTQLPMLPSEYFKRQCWCRSSPTSISPPICSSSSATTTWCSPPTSAPGQPFPVSRRHAARPALRSLVAQQDPLGQHRTTLWHGVSKDRRATQSTEPTEREEELIRGIPRTSFCFPRAPWIPWLFSLHLQPQLEKLAGRVAAP